jgi:glycine/D-amino acid oxidase-like deaminating enzyme
LTVDYIIIGQGICGSWLSYYLLKQNKTVLVIDEFNSSSASNIASGIINPVTGRRVVTTWMAEELLPFVWNEYNDLSTKFNTRFIKEKNGLVFPSAPDLQQAFYSRMNEGNHFIYPSPVSKKELYVYFNFPFDVMQIAPCYLINVKELLRKWRIFLKKENAVLEERFAENELIITDGFIRYKDITAKKIIYCNGIQAASSKYWKNLPFVQNKGQALVVGIPNLSQDHMYKFAHLTLIPWEKELWWIGSSNELEFETIEPTPEFRERTTAILTAILKTPFEIMEHLAALRPATVERRPFVGLHPQNNKIAILNGMGSKGCSLAPWFAKELAEHLTHSKPINPLADVSRYTKILSK